MEILIKYLSYVALAFLVIISLVLLEYIVISLLLQIKFTIEILKLKNEVSGFEDDDTKLEMLLALRDVNGFRKAIIDTYINEYNWLITWMLLMGYCLIWPSYSSQYMNDN